VFKETAPTPPSSPLPSHFQALRLLRGAAARVVIGGGVMAEIVNAAVMSRVRYDLKVSWGSWRCRGLAAARGGTGRVLMKIYAAVVRKW